MFINTNLDKVIKDLLIYRKDEKDLFYVKRKFYRRRCKNC